MVNRFCGKCGSPLRFPSQKFCNACGAPVPPVLSGSRARGLPIGIPRWLLVLVAVAVIAAACAALLPFFLHTIPATSSAGTSDSETGVNSASPAGPPLWALTPVSTTGTPAVFESPGTVPVTTIERTLPATSTPIVTTATATPVPTEVPVTRRTSQITLAATLIPPQPPASSYNSATPGAPVLDPSVIETRIHELINVQREHNGLAPLSYDPFLADIARGHSWDMVTRNFFDHVNPDGKNPRARGDAAGYPCIRTYKSYDTLGIAENLFQGNRYSAYTTTNGAITSYDWNSAEQVADTAVSGWMNSSGHRKNILTGTFEQEGIGVAFSGDDKIYVTENFC